MSPTLSKRINGKLASLTPIAPECCIFKLHRHLRNVNDKAYEPLLLAIGPYNHGKDGLGLMEEHKLRYLQQKLQRRNEQSLDTYIMALRELEESARKCYAECISQTKDEFVEMMLLDGCFIIELLCKWCGKVPKEGRDPIFDMDWMFDSIVRDLLLFENQLPFFVLTKLFEMSEFGRDSTELVRLATGFLSSQSLFGQTINGPSKETISVGKYVNGAVHILQNRNSSTHLLDLMHSGISFSVLNMEKNHAIVRQKAGGKFKKLLETFKHLSDLIRKAANLVDCTKLSNGAEIGDDWTLIRSATELHEAGVKFHKAEQGKIFGIKFNDRVLEISPLTIDDHTETILRNLIAYEQYSQDMNSHYATDYVSFLDDLINSPKDVEFLRLRGIIKNLLGDDEVTSTMVNKLGHNVYLPCNNIYAKIVKDLGKHCSSSQNIWMAKLRHNYFHSPWSLLSFIAAVLLLLLAITQTTFSIIN